MTPEKQKAEELINKYLNLGFKLFDQYLPKPIEAAKQCALITVKEISQETNTFDYKFWKKVKQEIENYGE